MKRIIKPIILTALSLLCVSCFTKVGMGLPQEITFPKEGGEFTYTADEYIGGISVTNYNATSESETEFEVIDHVVYKTHTNQWLTVSCNTGSKELHFIVEPRTEGKFETLYLRVFSGPTYAQIKLKHD